MSTFKFEQFAYEPDPEFDDFTFVKFETLKGEIITMYDDHMRIKDDSVKFMFTKDGDDTQYCTYTKAKSIVRTLQNIRDSEGVVPSIPVQIATYATGKGNDGYCFKDIE